MGNIQRSQRRSFSVTAGENTPRTASSSSVTFIGFRGRKKNKSDTHFRRSQIATSSSTTNYHRKRQKISSTPKQDHISQADSYTGELYYNNVKKLKKEECWETFRVFRIHKSPRQIHSVLFLSHDSGLIVHLLITHVRKCPRVALFFQGMKLSDIEDEEGVVFIDQSSIATLSTSAVGLFEIVESVMSNYGVYHSDLNSNKEFVDLLLSHLQSLNMADGNPSNTSVVQRHVETGASSSEEDIL